MRIMAPISITVNELFEYQLTVDDPDLDTFTFSMSPPILFIEPTTGKISHTPTKDQIGTYEDVVITVKDQGGLSDTKTVDIEINNKNTGPTLDPIGPQFPVVNQEFTLDITADDPDLIYNDVLTFSIEFDEIAQPEGMVIDPVTGKLTWTPKKPGSFWATIIVTDKSGAEAREFVTFTVERINTAPYGVSIQSPGDGAEFNSTSQITFIGVAKDDDVGDRLIFTWYMDGNQFGIGQNFRTVISQEGTHTIKLVVTDNRPGHEQSAEISITVVKAKKQQVTVNEDEKTEKTMVAGIGDYLLFLIIMVAVVVVVIIGATVYGRGGETRRKLKELEAEMLGEGATPPPVQQQEPPPPQ